MNARPDGRSVEIAGLRCEGRHGAYPGERDVLRTFVVDLVARGSFVDDDVATLTQLARDAVAAGSRNLLERVAADIASAVFDELAGIDEIAVRVMKPDPPGLDASSEAVAISFGRVTPAGARSPSAPFERPDPHRARG